MEKTAQSLKEQSEKLAETGEKSFWEKMKESGSTEEACKEVQSYVERYNATLSSLKNSTDVLDQYYCQMLQDAAEQNSEQLEKIGITIGKKGTLSIDKEKLSAASIEDIQNAFTGSGELASRTAFLSERVKDHAQAGIESASSQYDVKGNLYTQFASQFDFWG